MNQLAQAVHVVAEKQDEQAVFAWASYATCYAYAYLQNGQVLLKIKFLAIIITCKSKL